MKVGVASRDIVFCFCLDDIWACLNVGGTDPDERCQQNMYEREEIIDGGILSEKVAGD